jgi:putative tryptophan/tyrosine transport system substrate-binding protein
MDARYRLTRRRFVQGAGLTSLGLLAGCGRLPGQAAAPKPARIGILVNVGRREGASVTAITNALRDAGYIEGETAAIEFRSSEGKPERLPDYATDLVRLPVDVILAAGPPAVRAARDATLAIPIVMQYTGDPVADGLVASLARPGGNITGVTAMAPQLAGKRLELLRAVLPDLSRLAVLNVTVRGVVGLPELEAAAQVLGMQLQVVAVEIDQLESAFEKMVAVRADAVLLNAAGGTGLALPRIIDLASQWRLPVMSEDPTAVALGGLLSYGPNFEALYRNAAGYAVKILRGTRPADLPVEQPRVFDCAVNLRTAQVLGVTIPQHVLLQATEVIQ